MIFSLLSLKNRWLHGLRTFWNEIHRNQRSRRRRESLRSRPMAQILEDRCLLASPSLYLQSIVPGPTGFLGDIFQVTFSPGVGIVGSGETFVNLLPNQLNQINGPPETVLTDVSGVNQTFSPAIGSPPNGTPVLNATITANLPGGPSSAEINQEQLLNSSFRLQVPVLPDQDDSDGQPLVPSSLSLAWTPSTNGAGSPDSPGALDAALATDSQDSDFLAPRATTCASVSMDWWGLL
jgi:hypothetical protein